MMAGVLGWAPADVWPATLRELTIAYESRLVAEWDHTAMIHSAIHNLTCLLELVNLGKDSKPQMKQKNFSQCHPYRESVADEGNEQQGITPQTLGKLKGLVRGMIQRKHKS